MSISYRDSTGNSAEMAWMVRRNMTATGCSCMYGRWLDAASDSSKSILNPDRRSPPARGRPGANGRPDGLDPPRIDRRGSARVARCLPLFRLHVDAATAGRESPSERTEQATARATERTTGTSHCASHRTSNRNKPRREPPSKEPEQATARATERATGTSHGAGHHCWK